MVAVKNKLVGSELKKTFKFSMFAVGSAPAVPFATECKGSTLIMTPVSKTPGEPYDLTNSPITMNTDSIVTVQTQDLVHPLYDYLELEVTFTLLNVHSAYKQTSKVTINFPKCSVESDLLLPLTGLPTLGKKLMVSSSLNIIAPPKLRNDATGVNYSDLCGPVTLSVVPSIVGSSVTPQTTPSPSQKSGGSLTSSSYTVIDLGSA